MSSDAERYWNELVHRCACVLCMHIGMRQQSRTEGHHPDRDYPFYQAALCVEHHRGSTGLHGLSRRGFELRYKLDEAALVGLTNAQIATLLRRSP